MTAMLKPTEINLARLNNAEFTFFAGQICMYVNEGTVEALHVPRKPIRLFRQTITSW